MNERFIPHTFIKKVIIRTEAWFWTPLLKKDLALYFSAVSQLEDDLKKPYYMTQGKKIPFSIPRYCILSMVLPALERASLAAARNQAWLDVCKIGLALKIYRGKNGHYPDSLDELKPGTLPEIPLDTFTGKGLIYRKTTNSVIIYSVGENRKDDSGQWGKPSKWSDGYDIVWEE